MNSTELFEIVYNNSNFDKTNPKWWPNYGTFEVVIGAILTQNTKWDNVELALKNLKNYDLLNLEKLYEIDIETLANLIKPSGFYNIKAKRIKILIKAMQDDFNSFERFKECADREWLLSQKGIGFESCDAILCYACSKEEMVVDNYTLRILNYLNYEFQSYDEAKEWLSYLDIDMLLQKYEFDSINTIFCAYHGAIVEFSKVHFKGKLLSKEAKKLLELS
ncbi:3-methyladenine DNA glycosylase [Campylobacter blaseri]|uniref:Endonuclease III n=1 Tax=Campylobacter blaseri TaxID=2042961 RepID=A0A2P8R1Z2_9BACT|nr:3-methyladenine DNA glycosylase [Campylobacter blaseri]PSM52514.1 endonuclease III [Campylobacter blaseri]PSM54162.1 endonuclease III [Campylobacter blaseri]QKF85811.1 3-methyladenine DNA glycosylase [Campylobacter blaseri]